MTIPESICDRARRLAREAEATALVERTKEQRAFLQTILGECNLDEIPYDEKTKTYLICGWQWEIFCREGRYGLELRHGSVYRGMRIKYECAFNLIQLGEALLAIDKVVTFRDRYPATLWGAIRWWWARNE